MTTSINTNQQALIALQNLNATSASLAEVQNRISTGLKVASAKDNGAVWAVSQIENTQLSSLDAITNSLNNGKSILDTTLSAGSQLTDLLNQMNKDALAASDTGIDQTSRNQYQADFTKLAQSFANTVASATFNGVNLIDAGTGAVSALGSADGAVTVGSQHNAINPATILGTVSVLNITAGTVTAPATTASVDTVAASGTQWTAATAAADMAKVQAALSTVTTAMSGFGVDSKAIDNQLTTVSNMQDTLNTGIGNLIDADVAKESANLTALQTKQQLGAQALSIANSAPSIILSLFKGG